MFANRLTETTYLSTEPKEVTVASGTKYKYIYISIIFYEVIIRSTL